MQCKVACAASHCGNEKPVAGCAGILVYGACKVGAFVLGGVESKGGAVARQRKVVVNGLGNVDVLDGEILGSKELCDTVCGRSGIVSSNGNQELDVVVLEQAQVEIVLEVCVSGFETAHLHHLMQAGSGI